MPFSQHLENFSLDKFFPTKLKKKGKYVSNHLSSNLEPLFLNILIPHYQVQPPNFRKFNYNLIIMIELPSLQIKANRKQTGVNMNN